MKSKAILLFAIVAVAAQMVRAQDAGQSGAAPKGAPQTSPPAPESAAPAKMDPQLRADILRLLDVTETIPRAKSSMRSVLETMQTQVVDSLPDTPNREKIAAAYEDKLVGLTQTPEFREGIVDVYAKYFSDDDVKAMTAFYQTPAGQHFDEHMGDVVTDSMKAGQEVAAENLQRIFTELCKEFPELQGQASFCPASDEKKSQLIPHAARPGAPLD